MPNAQVVAGGGSGAPVDGSATVAAVQVAPPPAGQAVPVVAGGAASAEVAIVNGKNGI